MERIRKKIAIVGTTAHLSKDEEENIREAIASDLKKCPSDSLIISGGAKGVDKMALDVAKALGFETKEYKPEIDEWTPSNGKFGYKKRNLQIAQDCDELFCYSVSARTQKCYHHNSIQNHEKTAGCWTLNKVKEMKKPCQFSLVADWQKDVKCYNEIFKIFEV